MYYVYYLQSDCNLKQNYIGYTSDLKERLRKHNKGLVKSTKPYLPWKLIFYEAFLDMRDAKRREKYLKTTKGKKGLKLIVRNSVES